MATTAGLFLTTRPNIQSEFPLGNNNNNYCEREPLLAQVFFVTQTEKQGPHHIHTSPRHLASQQVAASWLSDGRDMLTCCPKCQHVLTSPAGSAAAAGTACTVAGLQLRMQEPEEICCPPSGTAITVRVPGWTTGGGSVVLQAAPQAAAGGIKVPTGEPSPSAPLSFVLPTTPTVILAGPGQQWSFLVTPAPPPTATPLPTQPPPPPPSIFNPNPASATTTRLQSDLDLRTLAATQAALRTSGWYYEGLSWQESANLLLPTTPGTFLVRDSSDPRYLFSLSVQTDRGPTSVRLHYADGHFRLDAETKIIPLMPLFDCVVKLVQHYTELTSDKNMSGVNSTTSDVDSSKMSGLITNTSVQNKNVSNFVANLKCPTDFSAVSTNVSGVNRNVSDTSKTRRKRSSARDQVWIDSTGQVYSHILLTSPLRQKDRFPSLMHLSRLAVNRLKSSANVPIGGALPLSLQKYLGDYPYIC